MLVYWIWLSRQKGLSNRKKLELCARYEDPQKLFEAGVLANCALDEAEKILADCHRLGIELVTAGDEAYPQRLLQISDPPLVLYYKGCLPDFDREAAVGVVGTRKASAYGLLSAERLARQISLCGGLVVSGMAAGIDTQAAWGALRAGKPTVAVLGGGVEQVYPASNRSLYQALEQQGCILSEYPPGTNATKWTFPQRNRIISGLSVAVLAVEAPEKSGTLITIADAKKQGRDVFAVPGQIDSAFCAGSNALLRDGAAAATCGWDILRAYQARFPGKLHEQGAAQAPFVPAAPVKPPKAKPAPPKVTVLGDTPQEQAVLSALAEGERTYDQIIQASGLEAQKALAVLTMLEIKGKVKTLPGSRAILC